MKPVPKHTTLAGYLKAAARQRYFLEPRLDDRRFVADGGTLYHAVDTDVVMLFTDPFKVSVATKRREEGYAQFFPDDNKDVSIAIGRLLGNFIFYHLDSARPLLTIPPMEQEVRTVLGVVKRNAELEQKEVYAGFERIRGLINRAKQIDEEEAKFDEISGEARVLAKFLAGQRGPSAELRRFVRLLVDRRLMPLEIAVKDGHVDEDGHRSAMDELKSLSERVALRDLREEWLERLLKEKSHAMRLVNIFDDAQVLARLEWINRALGPKGRLVLITGDNSMHFAASEYFVDSDKRSFAERFLRHPRAYLSEPWVLAPDKMDRIDQRTGRPETITEFTEWLDTFLGKFNIDRGDYIGSLGNLIRQGGDGIEALAGQIESESPEVVREFRERWEAYSSGAMLAHGFDEPIDKIEHESNQRLWDDLLSQFRSIDAQIDANLKMAWEEFFKTAAATGYGLVYADQGRENVLRPRNAPALTFTRFPKARDFIGKIVASYDTRNTKDYFDEMEKLRRDEDVSGYTYYLAFGVLFAMEGLWSVTGILSERALKLADERKASPVSGREAAYLHAVALRHAATTIDDLDGVAYYLDKAETCLEADKAQCADLSGGESRFPAERLALDLTRILFKRFRGIGRKPDNVALSDLIERAKVLLKDSGEEQDAFIRLNVERNLLTNLFMMSMLKANKPGPESDKNFREELTPYFSRFTRNLTDQGEILLTKTFLVQTVYDVAHWWLFADRKEKSSLSSALLNQRLSRSSIFANKVMPYDSDRFVLLRNFVLRNTLR